jgi:hypothetical protein
MASIWLGPREMPRNDIGVVLRQPVRPIPRLDMNRLPRLRPCTCCRPRNPRLVSSQFILFLVSRVELCGRPGAEGRGLWEVGKGREAREATLESVEGESDVRRHHLAECPDECVRAATDVAVAAWEPHL